MSTRHSTKPGAESTTPSGSAEPAIAVRSEHPQGAYSVRVLRNAGRRFLQSLEESRELSVLVTTDDDIQELNREWRGKDSPTDVLSFPQDEHEDDPGWQVHEDEPLLGDIVISLDTARRQAKEGGRPLSQELTRLLAHGLLHLLGHDHIDPEDARRMAAAETELLGSVGLVAEALAEHPADLEVKRAPRDSNSKADADSNSSSNIDSAPHSDSGSSNAADGGDGVSIPRTASASTPASTSPSLSVPTASTRSPEASRVSSRTTTPASRPSGSRRVPRKESHHVRALRD